MKANSFFKRIGDSIGKGRKPKVPRIATIMHIDVVDSTGMVVADMMRAHHQIQFLYRRLQNIASRYGGIARELRGDAAVFEFFDSGNAVVAARKIQDVSLMLNSGRMGITEPRVRIGISRGSVVIDDNTITGEAVILAQRLEQLAKPGEVVIDDSVKAKLASTQVSFDALGEKLLPGFSESRPVFRSVLATPG